ncbi:MAG: ABC-2 family transporter protein [Alphaproteobacteria bacterium]|nr:ABC-2 family transporter protein [Alphaproteobacteria bacterium]
MGSNFQFLLALVRMTFKSAVGQRSALLIRAFFSVITHLIYIPVWYVVFSVAPDLSGWRLEHALYAYGLAISCWGIVSLLAFGLRMIPEQIDHGELDSYLTLPKPVILSAAFSSSKNTGVGEVLFGVCLLIFCGIHYGFSFVPMPFFVLMGSVVFASGILFFATLGFWLKQFIGSAEEIYFNFNLMASRPAPIFTGALKIIALTLVPVSLMSHIPIDFVVHHHWLTLTYAVLGVAAYAVLAVSFFYLGLRFYESGNRFGIKG